MHLYLLGATETGSALGSFLPLILMFAIFYVLLILPQQKQKKRHKALIESLKKGDKVITSSGIYGEISKTDQDTVDIDIAKGLTIKISRDNISTKR